MGNNAVSFPPGSPPVSHQGSPSSSALFKKPFLTCVRNSVPVAGTVCRWPVAAPPPARSHAETPFPGWAAGGCPRASRPPPSRHPGRRQGKSRLCSKPAGPARGSAQGPRRAAGQPLRRTSSARRCSAAPSLLSHSSCGCEKHNCRTLRLLNIFITLTSFFLSSPSFFF